MLKNQEKAEFANIGIVCLRGFIPKAVTDRAKERILHELARLRLRENGKWQTKKFDNVPPFQVSGKIGAGIGHHPEFDQVIPQTLLPEVEDLAAARLSPGQARPQILVTPPQKDEWAIPSTGWHVDVARPKDDVVPGVQAFVLLDRVLPRGGATMIIKGSHRSRDIAPTGETVLEMSGRAGDLFLMDMRTVHAPSINSTNYARMMLTLRYMNTEV